MAAGRMSLEFRVESGLEIRCSKSSGGITRGNDCR